jgi:hypothetical protein
MRRLSVRRRQSIERELSALQAMRGHLRTRDILWAVLAIPLLIAVCALVAFKMHWLGGTPATALVGAAAAGLAIWWIGRRWFALAALIVVALLCLLLRTCRRSTGAAARTRPSPTARSSGGSSSNAPSRGARRCWAACRPERQRAGRRISGRLC